MDHAEDLEIIDGLIGKPCERSLACNSIKIRFDCDDDYRGTSYIWIDAPWKLQTSTALVTESFDYPHHEEPDYSAKFSKWSSKFGPLNQTLLKGANFTDYKELELEFEGEFFIYVPYCPNQPDDDEWYEHWYAKTVSSPV